MKLTNQAWEYLGEGPDEITKATNDREKMVERNYAMLEKRLLSVISHRKMLSSANSSKRIPKYFEYTPWCSNNVAISSSTRRGQSRIKKYLRGVRNTVSCKRGLSHDESTKKSMNGERKYSKVVKTDFEALSIIKKQLRKYVNKIADTYGKVHYHNFQHASHVTLSANKLVDILISCESQQNGAIEDDEENDKSTIPRECAKSDKDNNKKAVAENIEKIFSTFGISSDPLMQFALVFSALIHDVEHRGLPNAQLVREQDKLYSIYLNKSIAEQHSLAVAFSILAEPCFEELRGAIYGDECDKFRDLVIDLVLCTDISCPERIALQKSKWNIAFPSTQRAKSDSILYKNHAGLKKSSKKHERSGSATNHSSFNPSEPQIKLKAQVVLEQLMQIADVAHITQDWDVFIKWNKKLYDELWAANLADRGFDPSTNWFKGQIGFLDSYVIPLTNRVYESGVFGAQGKSFFINAHKNRERWIKEGGMETQKMIANVSYIKPNLKKEYGEKMYRDFSTRHTTVNRSTRAA